MKVKRMAELEIMRTEAANVPCGNYCLAQTNLNTQLGLYNTFFTGLTKDKLLNKISVWEDRGWKFTF
jgi:hypothetical protein